MQKSLRTIKGKLNVEAIKEKIVVISAVLEVTNRLLIF